MRQIRIGFGVAVSGCMLALATAGAHATPIGAYAFSENIVGQLSIGTTVASSLRLGSSSNAAADSALYDSNGPSGFSTSRPSFQPTDPAEAKNGPGPFPPGNSFGLTAGKAIGMHGARADAQILGGNPFSAPTGLSGAVAEGELFTGTNNATSQAQATTSFRFSLTKATALTIRFADLIALEAATSSVDGNSASAQSATDVVIFNSNGTKVFEFAPNGSGAHAILGGAAIADPFNLQTAISSNSGIPSDAKVGNTVAKAGFAAVTNVLGVGTYSFLIATQVGESVTTVPEPATLGILGAGLAALGWVRRRRA